MYSFRKVIDCLLIVQLCTKLKDAEMTVTQFLPLKNALRISQYKGWCVCLCVCVDDKYLNRVL